VHRPALPANESLRHFILKWAGYHVLTAELGCPFALVEAGPGLGRRRRGLPRHDALGIRFRPRRSAPPRLELPAAAVRLEVLGPDGRWAEVPAERLAEHASDPTLRAFERGPGGRDVPLRSVAPGREAGRLSVRRSGSERTEAVQLCAADAKQDGGDVRRWLEDAPARLRGVHLFLLCAPAGLIPPESLPPKVGLAEVDLEALLDAAGRPAIRLARWPEPLRAAGVWAPERTADFQRHAYYAMHALFQRRLFWFLAQEALDRRAARFPRGARP
jgi:hypothetical protein